MSFKRTERNLYNERGEWVGIEIVEHFSAGEVKAMYPQIATCKLFGVTAPSPQDDEQEPPQRP